jgi:uracil-DNA glycosylase
VSLKSLLREVRACTVCQSALPLGARPVLQAAPTARLLIVGQAPGRKVHATSVPWNDASGDRLRAWLQIDRATFYDAERVAIVPMGFCYPGAAGSGGDRPPRRECAPLWHARLVGSLRDIRCTLLVGQYAQKHYLRAARKSTLTETVRTFAAYGPRFFPLPHPSWRSVPWMRQNPWFEERVLANLREAVRAVV